MERSGTEGSPVAIKKSSEMDWVPGAGDPSASVGMTRRNLVGVKGERSASIHMTD
ncbi:hypothetical protein [Ravibacter arvi]|uniref:hypothetical protein n=1 Tax=Ravibacter arvi TaxID=2051041 RepID=UPI0031E4FBF8